MTLKGNIYTTKRLLIREFRADDAHALWELNNNPKVLQYTGDLPFENVAAAADFIMHYSHYAEYGFGRWAVVELNTNQLIGWCGLKYHPDHQYVDLGFRFMEEKWGQGYATEAGKGVLQYAYTQLGLSEIVARTYAENNASQAVLRNLGFNPHSRIRLDDRSAILFKWQAPHFSPPV